MLHSQSLDKNIEVSEFTRPIKVAYLVSASTNKINHWILDAIFHESYTRWGGTRTLIIPTTRSSFADERHEYWLELFDPDFIYTYVDISKKLINKIDQLCLPILLKKDPQKRNEPTRWRDFSPDLHLYFDGVSSLTTIHSPSNRHFGESVAQLPQLLTQYGMDDERFITDNFGHSYHKTSYTNPINGLFETYCFTSPEVINNRSMDIGTQKGASLNEVLSLLAQRKLQTFDKLATLHSEGIPKVEPH